MEYTPDVDLDELCPVCGDKVSGYHYGLLTCESCKGFFKRTVQNNKKYTCAETRDCRIDKTQRKRCPSCRFQKCLHVGMRLEAVRADRMRGGRNKFGPMYKRDRALKQQRKALMQAAGSSHDQQGFSVHPDLVSPRTPLPTAQHDDMRCLLPSLRCLLPSDLPSPSQHHGNYLSNWTINSSSAARAYTSSPPPGPGVPALVLELLRCDPDELQLQNKSAARLLQEQSGWNQHGRLDTFRLTCLLADQMLFFMVDWARTSIFFKQLKVRDQMKLLHNCWSELLLLDIISRQVLYGREDRLLLVTGQEVELSEIVAHASPALISLVQRGQNLVEKLHILKVDRQEFACMKFLTLFNPDVMELEDHQFIENVQEQVEGALLEYTLCTSTRYLERFAHLLLCLSELRSLSMLAEEYLCCKQLSADVPCNNLLIEMLHAKHSWP
ncbi:nuclear receptor subfamily 5 group A member 2-like [Betta splendens]|uniref:Nuclear receptor subfamily 5 group A member 2-like n=1 Tax=Betta splendens TaxID=158456 RepID=A0A6P7NYC8_BETSP|nr:nuclear receptor subfamily 5 group A member 2-like [Betta splendens]